MAPVASQSVVAGSVIVMAPLPSGLTVMVQFWLLPCVFRCALVIFPPLIVRALSRIRSYPALTFSLKVRSKVKLLPSWSAGTFAKLAVRSTTGVSAGGSSCVPEDDSPFSMAPVPVASSRVAWLGLDRVRVRVSSLSSSWSVRTVTWTVWEVSPVLKVRVPVLAV